MSDIYSNLQFDRSLRLTNEAFGVQVQQGSIIFPHEFGAACRKLRINNLFELVQATMISQDAISRRLGWTRDDVRMAARGLMDHLHREFPDNSAFNLDLPLPPTPILPVDGFKPKSDDI